MTPSLQKINDEVFIASSEIVRLDEQAVAFVRDQAVRNKRGRARICTHKDTTQPLQEMLIAVSATSYIRPHRHFARSESFHLVEGSADVVIFNDEGEIADVVELGGGRNFYYRLDTPRYHTILVHSAVLVIHETTTGPFDRATSDFARFAPQEGDAETTTYMDILRSRVRQWKHEHGLC